jgi:hypothetical protein
MSTRSIHEYDDLMDRLGLDVNKLGCVMLPMEPIDLFGDGRADILDIEDLYASNDPAKFWVAGDVSDKAHITLLYGLITPAYEQTENVDEVLASWDRPSYLAVDSVTFFPSPFKDEDGYAAIVAKVEDPHLDEAHARLSYLPHVNTFPSYEPHMTLAYVKLESAQRWCDILNLATLVLEVKQEGLDYGKQR